jgi:hypothetical protein
LARLAWPRPITESAPKSGNRPSACGAVVAGPAISGLLAIVVVDESGTKFHREAVYADAAKPGMSGREIGDFNRID